MTIVAEDLVRIEKRLEMRAIEPEDYPPLLKVVRHFLRCGERRAASRFNSERRRGREGRRAPKPGHGRNGADDFAGARQIRCEHPVLKSGGPCPNTGCKGRLHHADTAKSVEMTAAAPIDATVYACDVLRCSSCQDTFTAPLPEEATGQKYDPSVDAVVSTLNYTMGFPFYRLGRMQRWVGIPLAPSTQFERAVVMADNVYPIFRHLLGQGANETLAHSDDTGARILEVQKENEKKGRRERKGIFTTTIVAKDPEAKRPTIVLYRTGSKHAGENLDELHEQRLAEAGKLIHMADASSREPTFPNRIPAKCLTHARRYFVNAHDAFPEKCDHVLDEIAAVYRNETATVGFDPVARLAYHQEHSAPVMKRLHDWIKMQDEERLVEPNSRLGKALQYVRNHWEGLTMFLRVAGAPLDNNLAEQELKTSIRRRKNSLFFKTRFGALVGDILMSVGRTCVVNEEDPVNFFTAIGKNTARARANPEAWLPWTYKATLAALTAAVATAGPSPP